MYRPRRREVRADVLTSIGWVRGTFSLPHLQSLVDHLNSTGPFLKLTDVELPHRDGIAHFWALQRTSVVLIAPTSGDDGVETGGSEGITAPLWVSCFCPAGSLEGRLDFTINLRLSDYLRQPVDFLVLRDAAWRPYRTYGDSTSAPRHFACAVLSTRSLIAIEEAQAQPDAGHPGKLVESERWG